MHKQLKMLRGAVERLAVGAGSPPQGQGEQGAGSSGSSPREDRRPDESFSCSSIRRGCGAKCGAWMPRYAPSSAQSEIARRHAFATS